MSRNSRQLLKDLFQGKPLERIPFLPWAFSFTAKLEQVSVEAMMSDPAVLSRAVSNAQKLFGYDVILNHFYTALEAEACGCEVEWTDNAIIPEITNHPLEDGTDFLDLDINTLENKGKFPVVFEATKRLVLTKGKEVPVAALVTGPLTLAKQLMGDKFDELLEQKDYKTLDLVEDAGSICLKLCRDYCELGVDIVVIAEDLQNLVIPDVREVLASPLKSVFNVVKFYEVNSVLVSRVRDTATAHLMFSLGADAISVSGDFDTSGIADEVEKNNCAYACTVPDEVFTGSSPVSTAVKNIIGSGGTGTFLSSDWELPYDTEISAMKEIIELIRR